MNLPHELTTDQIRALVEELRQHYTAEREAGAAALEAAADHLEDLARCDGCGALGYRGERGYDLTPDGRDHGLDGCAGCEGDFCTDCRNVREDGDMWCHGCWLEKTDEPGTCSKCGRTAPLCKLEDPLRGGHGYETGGPQGWQGDPWESIVARLVCQGECA